MQTGGETEAVPLSSAGMRGSQPDEDVQIVIGLELQLLQPQVRASAAELENLLHPDFYEFGASGRTWDRSGTILALTGEAPPAEDAPATAAGITGIRLADDVVHVTYLSRRDQRSAHRSSIWLRTRAGWRLYFHQGTLTHIS
jgi:hypothetical protein